MALFDLKSKLRCKNTPLLSAAMFITELMSTGSLIHNNSFFMDDVLILSVLYSTGYKPLYVSIFEWMKGFLIFALTLLFAFNGCKKKEDLVDTKQNELIDITSEAQFDAGIKVGVSLVFFHASWCEVCAEQRPAVETVSVKSEFNEVFFAEVEYEDHKSIVKDRKIDGFPTVIIYKDNIEQKRFTSKGHSVETIEEALRKAMM